MKKKIKFYKNFEKMMKKNVQKAKSKTSETSIEAAGVTGSRLSVPVVLGVTVALSVLVVIVVIFVNASEKRSGTNNSGSPSKLPTTPGPSPSVPPAPIKSVCTSYDCSYTPVPITRNSSLNYFEVACSNHKTKQSCEADRCKWWYGSCLELTCTNSVRWKYEGDLTQKSITIKDFTWDIASCPELPFGNLPVPVTPTPTSGPTSGPTFGPTSGPTSVPTASSLTGQLMNPVDFDEKLTPAERLGWASKNVTYDELYTVDVDDLTDDEIRNTCLTMEDCINPPILTIIRVKNTKLPWRPNPNAYRNPNNDLTCCSFVGGGDWRTLKFLPPNAGNTFQNPVDIISNVFYPRITNGQPTTAENAKIIRVEFKMRNESTVLYSYIDMTCGSGAGFARRDGFMGQNMAKTNGIFPEVMYQSPDSMPNTHGPIKVNGIGFTGNSADFGGTGTLNPFFAMKGYKPLGSSNFEWVTWWQMWVFIPKFTRQQMVAAYLQSAVEWSYNSLPRGNIPVVTAYIRAAQKQYNLITAQQGPGVDFSQVSKYSKDYLQLKDSLDYLAAIDTNGNPRFMNLDAVTCTNSWPNSYFDKLKNWLNKNLLQPPEHWIEQGFCNVACKPYWDIIETARALTLAKQASQVPRCSRCPGLLGNFRETVSIQGKYANEWPWQPQCLPFRFPSGMIVTDPLDLVAWKTTPGLNDDFCSQITATTTGTPDPDTYTSEPGATEGPSDLDERFIAGKRVLPSAIT